MSNGVTQGLGEKWYNDKYDSALSSIFLVTMNTLNILSVTKLKDVSLYNLLTFYTAASHPEGSYVCFNRCFTLELITSQIPISKNKDHLSLQRTTLLILSLETRIQPLCPLKGVVGRGELLKSSKV